MEIVTIREVNRRFLAAIMAILMVTVGFNVMTEKLPEIPDIGISTACAEDPLDPPADKYVLIGFIREDADIGLYKGNWVMLFYNENQQKLKLMWNLDERSLVDYSDVTWAGLTFRMYYWHGNHERDRDDYKIAEYKTSCVPNTWEMHPSPPKYIPNVNIDWNQKVYWEVWGIVGGSHFTEDDQNWWDFWQTVGALLVGALAAFAVVASGGNPIVVAIASIAIGAMMDLVFSSYMQFLEDWTKEMQKWTNKFGFTVARDRMRVKKDTDFSVNIDWKSPGNPLQNLDTWNFRPAVGENNRGPYDLERYPITITGKRISKLRIDFSVDESKIYNCNFYGSPDDYWITNWPLHDYGKYDIDLTSAGDGPSNILMLYKEEWDDDIPLGIPIMSFKIEPVVDFEIEDGYAEGQPGDFTVYQTFEAKVRYFSVDYKVSPYTWQDSADVYIRFDMTPIWGSGTAVILIIALATGNGDVTINGTVYEFIKEIINGTDWTPPDGKYWEMYEAFWDSRPSHTIVLPKLPNPAFEPIVPQPNFEPAFDPAFGIPRNFEIRFQPDGNWRKSFTFDWERISVPEPSFDPAFKPAFDVTIEFPDTTTVVTIKDAFSTEPTIAIDSVDRSAIIIPGQSSEGQIVRVNDPDNVAKFTLSEGIVYDKVAVNLYEPDETVFIDITAGTHAEVTVLESGSQPKAPSASEIMVCASVGPSLTTNIDYYSGLYINPDVKIAEGTLTTAPSASYTTFTDLSALSLAIDKSDDPPSLRENEIGVNTPLIDLALEIYGNHLKPLYWVEDSGFAWECEYEDYIQSNPPNPGDLTTTFTISGYSNYPWANSIYWGLSNTGSKPDTINLEVGNVPVGWSATLKDESGTPVSSVSLNPEQTIPLFLDVTAPQTAQPREIKYIWVKSTSSADSTEWDYLVFKVVIVNRESVIWWPDLTHPSHAHYSLDLLFPLAGGNEIAYLKMPKTGDIRFSSMDITGSEVNSNYPTNVRIDIGIDGSIEWIYEDELSTSVTFYDSLYGRDRIFSDAIQNYIDSHQPDDSQGYIYVPVK